MALNVALNAQSVKMSGVGVTEVTDGSKASHPDAGSCVESGVQANPLLAIELAADEVISRVAITSQGDFNGRF